jgi:hypothetical protein
MSVLFLRDLKKKLAVLVYSTIPTYCTPKNTYNLDHHHARFQKYPTFVLHGMTVRRSESILFRDMRQKVLFGGLAGSKDSTHRRRHKRKHTTFQQAKFELTMQALE